MAQVIVTVPSVPKDWKSTLLGIIAAIGILLKAYIATGTFTYEGVAVAVLVAVICYFIPAPLTPEEQAALTATITSTVNQVAGDKIPAVMTAPQTVNPLEQAVVDTAANVQTINVGA